jgi:hypothetical protein
MEELLYEKVYTGKIYFVNLLFDCNKCDDKRLLIPGDFLSAKITDDSHLDRPWNMNAI